MRVAVDTNVIVRCLTRDDPAQAAEAMAAMDAADAVYLDIVVLCETVWVLRRAYRLPRDVIASALGDLLDSEKVEADRGAVAAGLAALRAGGDFADGVILHHAGRTDCATLLTFDRTLARAGGNGRVRVLPSG